MENLKEIEFYEILKESSSIKFRIINFSEIDLSNIASIEFIDCVFSKPITIFDNEESNEKKTIKLSKCIINHLHITKCNIDILSVFEIKIANKFSISNCKIDKFNFFDCLDLNCLIELKYNIFFEVFNFENNHFETGSLILYDNSFLKECIFQKNNFYILGFAKTVFKDFLALTNNTFSKERNADFFICEFQKADFSGLENVLFRFSYCNFYNNCLFNDIKYYITNEIKIEDCLFEKNLQFNKTSIYRLQIKDLKCEEIASFQDTFFDEIQIERAIFSQGALFDDIQIKNIDNCDRRTIRTIKLQLQKFDNKIDYNRFRVYEFNAYRKETNHKLKKYKKDINRFSHRKREPIQLKRDLFVLQISEFVSEYGTDWKRALKFTLITGFLFFTSFYILENFNLSIDSNNWEDFVFGYLRFFLITDFKNEYYETGESVLKFNCFLSLFPFIIGKIAVAFGLYEMIQSFRKFKS